MTVTSYCTLSRWRTLSGLSTTDVSDDDANEYITQAHYQLQREGFVRIIEEQVSKDSNDYYFVDYKYFADYDLDGSVDTDDIIVYEFDSDNKLLLDISDQVSTIDGLNNYFTLNSGYPRSSRQVYINYSIVNRPVTELIGTNGLFEEAVSEYTTYLALKKLKMLRMSRGIITWTSAGQTVTRGEKEFDEMVSERLKRYNAVINKIRPFFGKKTRVGRGTVERRRNTYQHEPLTHHGRITFS